MKRQRRWSVRLRLVCLLIAGVAPVMLVAISYITYRAACTLRQEAQRQLAAAANDLADNVTEWDSSLLLALENLGSRPELASMNEAAQRQALIKMAAIYRHLHHIAISDNTGQTIARSDLATKRFVGDEQWFQDVISGATVTHRRVVRQLEPSVVLAAAIRSQEQIVGVVWASTTTAELAKQVQASRLGSTGAAFVADENGRVIARPPEDLSIGWGDMSQCPPVAYGLKHRNPALIAFADAKGTRWISNAVPVPNGWTVVSLQREDEVLAEPTEFFRMAVAVTAITLLLVIAAVWIVSNQLGKPIAILTRAAEALSQGKWDAALPTTRSDELGVLARAFDQMRGELHRIYGAIEEKVTQRTSELRQSNQQLQGARNELQSSLESLGHAQALLLSVSNSAIDGIMAFKAIRNRQGVVVDLEWILANPSAERAAGVGAGGLLGHRFSDTPTLISDTILFAQFVEVIESGKPLDREHFSDAGPLSLWLHLSAVKLNDGLALTFSDITRQKQRQQLDDERTAVLEMVAANQDTDNILRRLATMAQSQCPGMAASMLVLDGGVMRQLASPTLAADFAKQVDDQAMQLAVALRTRERQPNEAVSHTELAIEPLWKDFLLAANAHQIRVCWSLPIFSSAQDMVGLLMLFGDAPRKPDAEIASSLQILGKLAAIAIEHRQLSDQLAHRAQHDPLTGLPNRALFEDRLHQALGMAHRNDQRVGLLFIDLDRFKYINDTLGHHAGDQLLTEVTERWSTCVRLTDTLARMGGDEFAIVLPELSDRTDAMRIANRLMDVLREPFHICDAEFLVTGSIGIAVFPQDGGDEGVLQRNADAAMYRAKNLGRNGIQCFAPEMNEQSLERLAMESQLRRALEATEFEVFYQPQVNIDQELIGFEALLRWRHPQRGLIPPAKFIPVAEETGLIIAMGDWILREACRQGRLWQQGGNRRVTVAVNVSPLQFARGDFVDRVIAAIHDSGIEPGLLKLELTESLLMNCTEDAVNKLLRIRELGVEVAIDDFGTGYSSLAYLQKLPIHALKIDRSFVAGLQFGSEAHSRASISSTAVIRAITSLAHSLGVKVIAEGVETEQQRALLEAIGCDSLQGYLFGQAMPAAEAFRFFAQFDGISRRAVA